MGKVSVIIPVYNTEEYIEDCLTSVTNQTYENLEVIIINDNSSEKCSKLLERLCEADHRFKLFHFQERKGVGAARNFGIQKATGQFVYFLDSDDYLPEDTIQFLVRHIGGHDLIRGRMRSTHLSSSFAIIFNGLFNVKQFEQNRYNLIKNNRALNFLIRRDFIINKKLSFAEDVYIYSDLNFIVPALIKAQQVPYLREAIYFKRRRNDPISNPSLSQYDDELRINDFLLMYNRLKSKYKNKLANEYLDRQLLNFYRKDIVTYFSDQTNIENVYKKLTESVKRIQPQVIATYDYFLKREIKSLRSGNFQKYTRVNSRHQLLRDLKEGFKTKRKFFIFLYRRVFSKLPIKKDTIFLESFLGKSYSDSPKYIYEYMIENNMDYKYVWSTQEEKDIPGNHIQVKRFSLRYFYYLARAKYWISNSRLPAYLDKREENVYLQTWHGTPLKRLVFDMQDIYSADPNYKSNFYSQSRRWDYLSSPNEYSSNIFRRAFKYDKEMLEFGYPRNDLLYKKNNEQDILKIKERLNIPSEKKVILYAPTWRDDQFYSRGKYKFTLQLDLERLQKELGEDYIILLRMHYFIASQLDISEYEGFVYDLSAYDDIGELYLISDILITDYSSVFFDYANLQRPILFYTYDLEKYRDTLRGFYIDLEKDVPGPLLRTTEEIIDSVKHIDDINKEYKEKYDLFYERFCKWDDGNASENTVNKVFKN